MASILPLSAFLLAHPEQGVELSTGEPVCPAQQARQAAAASARPGGPGSGGIKRKGNASNQADPHAVAACVEVQTAVEAMSQAESRVASQPHPVIHALQTLLSAAPNVTYFDITSKQGPLTAAETTFVLSQQTFQLPLFTASHESLLLQESGTFSRGSVEVTFPGCKNGALCVGMTLPLAQQPRRVQWCAAMTPSEYASLVEAQSPPPHVRPCILCCRDFYTRVLTTERMLLLSVPGSTALPPLQWLDERVRPWYRNRVNQADGYHARHMMMRQAGVAEEACLDPFVTPSRSVLCCKESDQWISPGTNRRRLVVDQSAIVFTDAPVPAPKPVEQLHAYLQSLRGHMESEFVRPCGSSRAAISGSGSSSNM